MSDKKLGAAVIGLRMGRGHLEGYRRNSQVRIAGVCDPDPELLSETQKEYQAEAVAADYRELLKNPAIDLVSVASPDFFHLEQSVAFLRAGKDVLCEKPMTATVEEAKELARVVRETGRKFMVGQVCRYAPGFVLARNMVARGEIGELFLVESEYAHNYTNSPGKGNWRKDKRREPFLGGGSHAVDLLRWVAGEAREVSAYANHKCLADWPVNDCTLAIFRFAGDVVGKVMVSIGCVRPYTMRSVFYGAEGTIICDNTSPKIQLCSRKNFSGQPVFADFPVDVASHNVAAEIREFVDCIVNDKPVLTDVLEGARTVNTCLAAVESVRTGRPVTIEPIT